MEKAYERAKTAATAMGVDLATVDTNKVGEQVERLRHLTMAAISLNTLVTLLRAAALRKDPELLETLAKVVEQFDKDDISMLPKYKTECEQVLGSSSPAHKKAKTAAPQAMP